MDFSTIIFGFSIYAWITMLTVVSIFVLMARSRIPAEVTFLGALTVLLVTGVVTEEEGMAGFGSEPVVIHAAFFVIIAGLMQSGVLYWLTKHVLGEPKNYRYALIRLMLPISLLAALLNSVNVVALFIDAVKIWARKLNIAPSKLLLPLSYAATLGGMCTLLGNSSNLVIAGLYLQKTGCTMNPHPRREPSGLEQRRRLPVAPGEGRLRLRRRQQQPPVVQRQLHARGRRLGPCRVLLREPAASRPHALHVS